MLAQFIETKKNRFSVEKIINSGSLDTAHSTGFVWSAKPGTVCLAANRKYFQKAHSNPDVAVIICPPSAVWKSDRADLSVIVATSAAELFYELHNSEFNTRHLSEELPNGVSRSAQISPNAIIENNVEIGDDTIVEDGCIVKSGSRIGAGCHLYESVIVGSEGFFSKDIDGKKNHVTHFGGVRIGDGCIIHAATNVSRSVNLQEDTVLKNSVHVGIQSNIGHDCYVGEGADISAKVMLAGRVRVGKNAWIGAGAVVSNEVSVGDKARVSIGSVVVEDVQEGDSVAGNFAISLKQHIHNHRKLKAERLR
ncbi:MAG: DapH/DapD/GlmU-related protein [Pseudomonadota bacterium]